MKKVRFPIVWILLLAAICALTAALAKNIKWVRQEFPMDGSNVSQLDSAQIAGKIAKTQKLKNSEALYVNADNFELLLIPRDEKAETDAEGTEDAVAGTQRLHLFYENAAA